MLDGWINWLRLSGRVRRRLQRAVSVLCLGSLLSGSDRLCGQEWMSLPRERFAESAASADQPPRPPVRFIWHDDEQVEPSDEMERPIRHAAFQNQYPLSKDSEDLLPREDHWNRLTQDSPDEAAGMPPDIPSHSADGLFSDNDDDSSWIVWKKTIGTATWIAPNSGGLGITSLDVRGSVEFPNFQALWFVPRFAAHSLNGPTSTDLPAQFYDFSFESVVALPIGEKWFVQAALAPSLFTDSHNTGRKAFRLPGRVLAFWKYSDTLTFTGGILYLDRDDVKALPSAGLLWNPNEDWKFELAAPRPRIAWRFSHDDSSARWGYVVGEFGGGTWAIRRASGLNDVATLSDYRLMLGYEHKWTSGRSWLVETGYVFSRRLKYTSTLGNTDLPGTALMRLGVTF